MKNTIITILMLATSFTFAATQTQNLTNKATDNKNNEELRSALLNLNATQNALSNLGENKNSDLVDELSNNDVNNGLNNLKNTNN